jgi:SAM-dependent methyltransferase
MKCYVCQGICDKDVIHSGYTYWKCRECLTSQVLPSPSEDELKQYYDSFHLSMADGGLYDDVESRMQADFPAKIQLVKKIVGSAEIRLLDVGCGKGYFVKAVSDAKLDAEGIDLSFSGVEHAVQKLGVKATVGRIEQVGHAEWKDKFDVATLWATVEHLSDPAATLLAIKDCLKPGGILFCDTGLGGGWQERLLPGHNQWYDAPQHLFVFSKSGLIQMLEQSGFDVLYIDSNFERSPLRRFIRYLRHSVLCLLGGFVIGPLLGKQGFVKMELEAKWPIGLLISIVAKKR